MLGWRVFSLYIGVTCSTPDVADEFGEAHSNRVLAGATPIVQTQRATAAGVKGVSPPCRRRRFHEEPWYTTDVRFVVPAGVEDSTLAP